MEIGKKLRTLRAERGFTQEKMADLLSIPQASYSNLENNKGKIDLKTIIFFLFSCLNVIVRFLHKITAIDFLQNP